MVMIRNAQKGFTLIEVLISIVILIVGLVGVLLVIPLGQRAAGRSALASRAAIVATEKVEELKAKGFDELVSQATWEGTDEEFSWTATVDNVDADDFQNLIALPTEQLVKITMDVLYVSNGKERHETVVTFYSEL